MDFFDKYPKARRGWRVGKATFLAHQERAARLAAMRTKVKLERWARPRKKRKADATE